MPEPQKTQQTDPFEAAAQAYKAGGAQSASPEGASGGNDDWKVWQQGDTQDQAPPQTTLQRIGSTALDLLKGAGEGAVSTMSAGDDWARKHLPAFFTNSDFGFGPPANEQHVKDLATPANTTQKIGKFGEQAGEFLIPGAGEERAGLTLKKVLSASPNLEKIAPLAAKVIPSAVGSGVINKMQGGTFKGGAAAGALGGAVGHGLQKIAPTIAETAMKVRGTDRAYGRTPGLSILDETTGLAPGKIAKQAGEKVAQYTSDLDNAARSSNTPVDLEPARDTSASWYDSADERNNDLTKNQVKKIGKQLDERNGQPIPRFVDAHQGLALRRGIDDLQTSWNPAITPDFSSRAVTATRNAMTPELENAIPGYKNFTGRISTLMPVEKRAAAADLNAGLLQRTIGRFATHTGSLTLGGLAGAEDYRRSGNLPEALGVGAAGVLAPEILSTPHVWMGAARSAYAPAMRNLFIPAMEGAALNAFGRDKQQKQ